MATFYNQASLSFNGRITNSNITEGELVDTISATKTALSSVYGANDRIVYVINITNSNTTGITGVTVTDDLGAYSVGTTTVYPLDYVDGSVRLFINGAESAAPTVTATSPLTLTGINIPAGANASIYYEASTNAFTPLAPDSSITNTAAIDSGGESITVTDTVNVGESTELTIAKAICPATVTDNGEITYTFVIQNSGNREAIATDDVIVTDLFNPILDPIAVTYNGTPWTEGTNYTYDETTGEFATLPGEITVPAATYIQDPASGVFTVTPGVAVITVTGTV